jgi:hypothetical protein
MVIPFIVGARERFYIDKTEVLERGINKNRTNKGKMFYLLVAIVVKKR